MAASKKTASKKKSSSKAVANVDAALQQEVGDIKNQVGAPQTNNISTKDKMFTFPDGRVLETLDGFVIVDFLSWNAYYPDKFDPNNPKPPVCFAYGKEISDLVPSENSPELQADACNGCWANEFGSDGNGKACKNTRRLALVDSRDEDPANAELYILSVPPTSLKKFDAFVNGVARFYQKPPIAVTCDIAFHPESTYASLLFHNPQPNPAYREHFGLREAAREMLEAEPDLSNYEPARGARGKKVASKKKAAARR